MLQTNLYVFCCSFYCSSIGKKKRARAANFVAHLFAVVLHDFNVNLPNAGFMEEMSHELLFALFFSVPLIFRSVAASISHFLTTGTKIFMFFFQRNSSPLLSYSSFSLSFSGIHVSEGIKI